MRSRLLLPALVLGLGLAALALLPTTAAPADAAKIEKLIKQLGSGDFEEREQATKDLDALGVKALPQLRKALKSDDVEVKRRAGDLVKKWEKKELSAKVLAAKRVHLVYKDTPLKEAVADLNKKSGYSIAVYDPDNKLKDKKITLDTGDTTFWHAFDLFCDKAGLKEATYTDLMPKMRPFPGGPGGPPGGPPGGFVPLPPTTKPALPPRKALPPERPPATTKKPAPTPAVPKKGAVKDKPAPATKPVPAGKAKPAPATPPDPPVTPPPPPAVAPPVAAPFPLPPGVKPPAGMMPPNMGGLNLLAAGHLVLVPGKAKKVPTDDSSSIRIRPAEMPAFFRVPAEQVLIALQVTPEPRIRWQYAESVKILKAIDDKGQKLKEFVEPARPGAGGFPGGGIAFPGGVWGGGMMGGPMMGPGGGMNMVYLRLKKGDKASKELKELKGTITAKVLSDPETVITVGDLAKAKGKTFKGGEAGYIKVTSVTKGKDGQLEVRFEMQAPSDYVPDYNMPANMPGMMPGGMPGMGGGVFIMPAPAIRLVPPVAPVAPPPAPKPPATKPPAKKGAKAPAPAAPVAAKPVAIRIRVGGAVAARPALALMRPMGGYGYGGQNGISLVDDKGKTLPANVMIRGNRFEAGRWIPEYQMVYRPQKGQGEPAKLVFKGRKVLTIEVPFALKHVKVPDGKGGAVPPGGGFPVPPPPPGAPATKLPIGR